VRLVSLTILIAFVVTVVVFAVQNDPDITVVIFSVPVTAHVRLIVAVTFLLGMVSGWALFDLLRRSFADVFGAADHGRKA
jgi:hypothetical protein